MFTNFYLGCFVSWIFWAIVGNLLENHTQNFKEEGNIALIIAGVFASIFIICTPFVLVYHLLH